MRRTRVAARPRNAWLAPLMPDAGDPVSRTLAATMNTAERAPAMPPVIAMRRVWPTISSKLMATPLRQPLREDAQRAPQARRCKREARRAHARTGACAARAPQYFAAG